MGVPQCTQTLHRMGWRWVWCWADQLHLAHRTAEKERGDISASMKQRVTAAMGDPHTKTVVWGGCWELRELQRSMVPMTNRCMISNCQTCPLWSHHLCHHWETEHIAFACSSTDLAIFPHSFDFFILKVSEALLHLRQAPFNLLLSSVQKSWECKREGRLERC